MCMCVKPWYADELGYYIISQSNVKEAFKAAADAKSEIETWKCRKRIHVYHETARLAIMYKMRFDPDVSITDAFTPGERHYVYARSAHIGTSADHRDDYTEISIVNGCIKSTAHYFWDAQGTKRAKRCVMAFIID